MTTKKTSLDDYKNKKVLIVAIGRTGFALINFFNNLECDIKVTDIKPMFNLNKAIKKLKRIKPTPQSCFGEHREEDFLEADVIIYSSSVSPELPQLELARKNGKEVLSEFQLANKLCKSPIIAVCGSRGRTTVTHMIGYTLKLEGKNIFVGGSPDVPFISLFEDPHYDKMDYVIIEASALQLNRTEYFKPMLVVYTNIKEDETDILNNYEKHLEIQTGPIKNLSKKDFLIINFDKLAGYSFFRNQETQRYWYSRRSFVKMGVMNEVQGTHFHEKRIHSNIHFHSEFLVNNIRIVGEHNRENLLASVTACKALKTSDKSIQELIVKFPGVPHHLEYLTERNGVQFYNDSQSETMEQLVESVNSFKKPIILIAGGRETKQNYEAYASQINGKVRTMVLVGECKEKMNRAMGSYTQTYLVGSFEESILISYQKSRTGDIILLCPGNPATDLFRDFKERGNYYKKLIYQF